MKLIRASTYFFQFNLIVRHRSDKSNVTSNALNRLFTKDIFSDIDSLEIDSNYVIIYHMSLVFMSNDFRKAFDRIYREFSLKQDNDNVKNIKD